MTDTTATTEIDATTHDTVDYQVCYERMREMVEGIADSTKIVKDVIMNTEGLSPSDRASLLGYALSFIITWTGGNTPPNGEDYYHNTQHVVDWCFYKGLSDLGCMFGSQIGRLIEYASFPKYIEPMARIWDVWEELLLPLYVGPFTQDDDPGEEMNYEAYFPLSQ